MERQESNATQIKPKGWRQGSVLPASLAKTLHEKDLLPWQLSEDELLIVISHDCDVTNADFHVEPQVEFIRVALLPKSHKHGHYFWAKNPRTYQLEDPSTGASVVWQFSIHDRVSVPRQFLLNAAPDQQRSLSLHNLKRLRLWLARRYSRVAFPDAFNERIHAATKQLRSKLKSKGDLLTAIYLLVPDKELTTGESYDIIMYGSMRVEDFDVPEKRKEAQKVLDKVEAALAVCDGIDIKESALRSEAAISLDEVRKLKRWDFDDLTVRGESIADLPAEDDS
jgi:hypothetical protein